MLKQASSVTLYLLCVLVSDTSISTTSSLSSPSTQTLPQEKFAPAEKGVNRQTEKFIHKFDGSFETTQRLQSMVPVCSAENKTVFSFSNNIQYDDEVKKIVANYQEVRLSKDSSLCLIKAANEYATVKLDRPLYPQEGTRREVRELFGFVYQIDEKIDGEFLKKFRNIKEYTSGLEKVIQDYETGKMSKTEALGLIEGANRHATEELSTRFYPPYGLREQIAQRFNFVYEPDQKKNDVREKAQNSESWPDLIVPDYWYSLAEESIRKESYISAIDFGNKALRIDPQFSKAYFVIGKAYSGRKEYSKAIDNYNQSIGISPDFAEAFYTRGNAHSKLKNYKKAIEDHTRAISINSEYSKAYANRGFAHFQLKDKCNARQDWQKAASLFKEQNDVTSYELALKNLKTISPSEASCRS